MWVSSWSTEATKRINLRKGEALDHRVDRTNLPEHSVIKIAVDSFKLRKVITKGKKYLASAKKVKCQASITAADVLTNVQVHSYARWHTDISLELSTDAHDSKSKNKSKSIQKPSSNEEIKELRQIIDDKDR